jgi:4-alpha-glucanotransferase
LSDNTRPNLPRFRSGYRACDLLLHVTSLPSPDALAMAPLQDILNLGAEARMNIPGRAEGNWSWRSTEELLSAADFHALQDLTSSSNRLPMVLKPAIEMAEAAL